MSSSRGSNSSLVGISLASIVLIVTVLAIPLAAGQAMGLSAAQLATWIAGLYGVPSVVAILLVVRYRQPLAVTGTFLAIILVASVGERYSYAELVGAFMVSGAVVALAGAAGVTRSLSRWIPAPIVLGLLAGAVLPFVIGIFSPLGDHTLMAGAVLVTYLTARWLLGPNPIAILPALVAGVGAAGLTGRLGQVPEVVVFPTPVLTWPVFSLQAIATLTPVVVVLMTVQANIPSSILLRTNAYDPPERALDMASGLGTVLASFLGPVAVSLSLPATALISGKEAGEHGQRHRAVYVVAAAALVIAVLAGAAAVVAELIPGTLLVALAGLAILGVFIGSLQETTKGPLVLGPVFAFVVAFSDVSLLGFGPFFWALVLGIGVSLLLEREELAALETPPSGSFSSGRGSER